MNKNFITGLISLTLTVAIIYTTIEVKKIKKELNDLLKK